LIDPSPGQEKPRAGRAWGPGRPGQRKPAPPRVSFASQVDLRRLFFIGAMFLFLVVYMAFGRPERASRAEPGDEARVGSATATAPVDSSARARPFQGLLESAVDRAPLDQVETSDAYRALLWNLKMLTVAEVGSRAEAYSAAELVRGPEACRGQFVHATGVLVAPLTLRRLPKNEAGIETAWRGILVDTSAAEPEAAIAFGARPVATLDELEGLIRDEWADLGSRNRDGASSVIIDGEPGVPWRDVVGVLGRVEELEIPRVGLAQPLAGSTGRG